MQNVATVAALRALTSATDPTAFLEGYVAVADGGGGEFVYDPTDTTSADNGGTIIVDASGHRWKRQYSGALNVRWFGARGNLTNDDTSAIQATINAAAGNPVYAPVGQYKVTSTISSTLPVNLFGAGNGCGPGPAAISNANCTQFYAMFGNNNIFSVTSNYPSTFRDFQINVDPLSRPAVSGAGISISGPSGSTTEMSKIENIGIQCTYVGIILTRPSQCAIRGCFFTSWIYTAVYCQTTSTNEGAPGWIENNVFFGDTSPSTSQGSAILCSTGYVTIARNLILGSQYGIVLAIAAYPAGAPRIFQNWIEEQTITSIDVYSVAGQPCTMLSIEQNEFSVVDNAANFQGHIFVRDYGSGTDWIDLVTISGNVMRSQLTANAKYIWVQSGRNVQINRNQLANLAQVLPIGIQVTGVTQNTQLKAPIELVGNQYQGSFSARFLLPSTGSARVDFQDGMTFAEVAAAGVFRNGSAVYVTDGKATSSTNPALTSGGAGCLAVVQRGTWYAPYGLT